VLTPVAGSDEARRLPRGSHGIPAAVISRNQRERLVAAIVEECAEVGYAEATVAAVAKRAGVSSLTFSPKLRPVPIG
jgi:AcrR family transcriptional regulator